MTIWNKLIQQLILGGEVETKLALHLMKEMEDKKALVAYYYIGNEYRESLGLVKNYDFMRFESVDDLLNMVDSFTDNFRYTLRDEERAYEYLKDLKRKL